MSTPVFPLFMDDDIFDVPLVTVVPTAYLRRCERAVPAARKMVVHMLALRPDLPVEWPATTVVSELVTNAVRHTVGQMVMVTLLCPEPDELRVEVQDNSKAQPEPRVAAEEDEGGRGLDLVSMLSRQWGVDQYASGKAVWADINEACLV